MPDVAFWRPIVACALGCLVSVIGSLPGPSAGAAEPPRGYQAEVTVSAPTRMDWVFALANQSAPEPPAQWLDGYDWSQQQYELFVPQDYKPRQSYPVLVFIPAGGEPAGWDAWREICQRQKIIFASPRGAGNDCPLPRRVRIVFDVLDDIRRAYRTDPDRTYLSGFSGGARVACSVAFALPEYFGGVAPVCAGGDLRDEPWLRQRVVDRLSVALVTGESDFNRGEVERYRAGLLGGVGARTKVWVVPGMGHGIPTANALQPVWSWLEEGVADRRKFSRQYPAGRISGDAAPGRNEWCQALLAEAKARLKRPDTMFSGLMQLQGARVRWADLPQAKEALALLQEYDARDERPWEADDLADQRRLLVAQARSLDAYASGNLPEQYAAQRPQMIEQAIALWQRVQEDGPDTPLGREAAQRMDALSKLADE